MKQVLVTERIAPEGIDILMSKGYLVDEMLDLSPEKLLEVIPEYDALIVRGTTKVTAEVLDAAKKLRVIGRAGVTLDNVDISAATERGIIVCNAPVSNIVSAAEHTLALILACTRKVPQAHASVQDGKWEREAFTGMELYRKTVAIFGLGRVGGLVADRLRGFNVNLIGYDPYCSNDRAGQLGVKLYDDVDEVCKLADVITVHLPKTDDTIGMFGPDQYAEMKDGVVLVNTARGGIFNIESLLDFLAAGKIGAVGLDVFEEEPLGESELLDFDNAILTPHIAAVTKEAQQRASAQIGEYVATGLSGSIVPTAVNLVSAAPEIMDNVSPFIPACEMAGVVLAQMIDGVPDRMTVVSAGLLHDSDVGPLVYGTVKGLLSYKGLATVTPATAASAAKRHGIDLRTQKSFDAMGYKSAVSAYADKYEISCTLTDNQSRPRIISLNGYKLDITPADNALVFEYEDAPGRVGIIGTILGDAGVNITTMQIGTKPQQKRALVFMNIEGQVTEQVEENLRIALDDVLVNLWTLSL